jgi:hypothetical protein
VLVGLHSEESRRGDEKRREDNIERYKMHWLVYTRQL